MPLRERIIGIDLGTTNSCVAVSEFGKTVVIPNIEGGRTTPSVVYLDHSGSRLIGAPAKRRAIKYPDRTIASVKRHMGSNHRVVVDNIAYSPEQISSYILEKLKSQAEDYLNEKVEKAIITVPAYFDDSQRLSTRHAGKLAGLDVLRVINEPTACALAYGLNKVSPGQEMNIIIFDFGGGTFDVSILHISEGVVQVKSTSGNNRLGGDDFDTRVAQYINSHVIQKHGVNPGVDIVARMRLTEAAEKVKIDLSGMRVANVQMPFLAVAKGGDPVHLDMNVSLEEFNRITADLVRATAQPIETALADAKLKANQIEKVVLVGGTTRVPAVQQFIRSYFNMEPAKTINPDEACAIGAAIQGGILCGEIDDLLLLDVIPMSLGVETDGGACTKIIERNTAIPVSRTHTFMTNKANQTNLAVHVLQGEGQTAAGNISLARFQINDIPKGPPGQKVEIEFHVDADGIFQCGYKHAASQRQAIVLKRTSGYDFEQLEKLLGEERELLALRAKAQAELDAEEASLRKGETPKRPTSQLPKPPGQQSRPMGATGQHSMPNFDRAGQNQQPPAGQRIGQSNEEDFRQRTFMDSIKEFFANLFGKK